MYPWTAQFFSGIGLPPIISGTGKATAVHSEGPSEQKPIKNLGEKGAWAYPGTTQFFRVPLLSQEWVKLRTSNFACTFIGSIGTKAH